MQYRAAIINMITVIFVLGSLFFIYKHNDIPTLVEHEFQNNTQTPSVASDALTTTITPRAQTPGPLKTFTKPNVTVKTASSVFTVAGIILATNLRRTENDRVPLTESAKLDASALVKAKDILARQYFEHTAPDGKNVGTLVDEQGYAYVRIGENLALGGFTDDASIVTAWMNSAGHRANILQPSYTEIGVGIAEGYYKGDKVVVAVQHFGRPRSLCPAVDKNLQQDILTGQARLDKLSTSLESLKIEIDRQRGSGVDTTGLASSYNMGVDTYDAQYSTIDGFRTTYNAQVDAFNACLEALQ